MFYNFNDFNKEVGTSGRRMTAGGIGADGKRVKGPRGDNMDLINGPGTQGGLRT